MSGNTDMRKNQPRSDRGGGKHESFFHRLGKRLFAGFADELREEIRQDLQRETQELERSVEAWTWERYQRTEKLVENWTWERYQQTEKLLKDTIDRRLQKLMPLPSLRTLDVHIAEHCNLNCQCCDDFSPIAEEQYTDYDSLARDFARLRELSHGQVGTIYLDGGEPLLHPRIADFVSLTREHFEESDIYVVTNGILLAQMPEAFWEKCAASHAGVLITKYPIHLDMETIEAKAAERGVVWRFYDESADYKEKTTTFMPLDMHGGHESYRNFVNCYHANYCIYLWEGRIYTCSIAASIRHFNRFFHEDLPDVPENSISIYEAKDMDEILRFLCRPIPLCEYCDIPGRTFGIPWGISKQEKSEWAHV